jgi:hypothetical protein
MKHAKIGSMSSDPRLPADIRNHYLVGPNPAGLNPASKKIEAPKRTPGEWTIPLPDGSTMTIKSWGFSAVIQDKNGRKILESKHGDASFEKNQDLEFDRSTLEDTLKNLDLNGPNGAVNALECARSMILQGFDQIIDDPENNDSILWASTTKKTCFPIPRQGILHQYIEIFLSDGLGMDFALSKDVDIRSKVVKSARKLRLFGERGWVDGVSYVRTAISSGYTHLVESQSEKTIWMWNPKTNTYKPLPRGSAVHLYAQLLIDEKGILQDDRNISALPDGTSQLPA